MHFTKRCTGPEDCADKSKCEYDDCTSWTEKKCGGGGCAGDEMYYTRDCEYNCRSEEKCVKEARCGAVTLELIREKVFAIFGLS